VDIAEKIVAATAEIFDTMVMMNVTPGKPMSAKNTTLESSITGMIGLAGLYKGVLAIHVPDPVAISITTNFLGIEVAEMNEDVQDAIGELTNMLGGSVKAILSANGRDIELSLPSTIAGAKYTFKCKDDADLFLLPFAVDGVHEFFIELQLEKN
jgi:chemotaxis protein CheX